MKNSYSIAQRNALVEAHLSCINDVMRSNRKLIRAARLDRDDVYQQLALRLIKAVETFDPDKGDLETHIKAQLRYELLDCRSAYRRYGITNAPKSFGGIIASLDAYRDHMNELELAMAA
jgi:DNA-directed RNA polymerase specialized sigma subunit